MSDNTADLDLTDEDILTCDVSDEALESAGFSAMGTPPMQSAWTALAVRPPVCC
jgi:hypothetical protein